jgi:hypothetical protein
VISVFGALVDTVTRYMQDWTTFDILCAWTNETGQINTQLIDLNPKFSFPNFLGRSKFWIDVRKYYFKLRGMMASQACSYFPKVSCFFLVMSDNIRPFFLSKLSIVHYDRWKLCILIYRHKEDHNCSVVHMMFICKVWSFVLRVWSHLFST